MCSVAAIPSRLNLEIRIKRGLSYGASSRSGARKQAAPVIAAAQTRNDAVPQVVELMSARLDQWALRKSRRRNWPTARP